ISQPANSTSLAPARRWASNRGVRRSDIETSGPASPRILSAETPRSSRVARGLQSVRQEHGDGHRTHAARDRRDGGRALLGRVELHVAHEFAVGEAVDADVDDVGALLDPGALDQTGPAHRGHHDVGLSHLGLEVRRARVADRHGGVGAEEKEGHRLAHDVGAPDDHGLLPARVAAGFLEQPHHAEGRARANAVRAAGEELAGVDEVEAVHVLLRCDGVEHLLLVHLAGEGELDEDAVDRRILVEAPNDGEDLRGGRVLREVVLLGVKAHLLAGLDLAPHVDLRGGIVAHPHHREPGRPPALLHEDLRRLGHLAADLRRDRLSVDDACAHAALVARGAKERATRMQSAPTGAWHPGRTDLPLLPMPAEILAEALRAMGQSVPWLLSATVAALALLGLERRRPAQAVAGAIVLSVGLGLGLAFAWRILWIADDAFISFRYARNFARGLGLVYNEGEW